MVKLYWWRVKAREKVGKAFSSEIFIIKYIDKSNAYQFHSKTNQDKYYDIIKKTILKEYGIITMIIDEKYIKLMFSHFIQ